MFVHIQHLRIAKDLFDLRPLLLAMGHQFGDKIGEFLGIRGPYLLILSDHYLFKQFVWRLSSEGRFQHTHFVEHAAQRPHIAFEVVRLFVPHLWRGIVRRSGLSGGERVDKVFGYIKIS